MATWSTRAAVRGTGGPPWSPRNSDCLRLSRSPSQSSSVMSPQPPCMESEPVTPLEELDWLQESQLSNNGELTVTERLATLLDSGQFADVSIRVGQGSDLKTFKAHRLLLATASQPLYKLVSTIQQGHCDLNSFRITDIEPEAFKNVLTYIYTDTVKINSIVEAFGLLKAGTKWSLKNMNSKTIKYLEDFLDEFSPSSDQKKNEIFDILMLSETHSKELFEKCLNIVIKYAKEIIPCQGFLRLDDRSIRSLFNHSGFEFDDQVVLFEAIRDWGMNQILLKGLNPTQLHPTIEDLLTHVDFSKIPDTDFMGTILPSDCLGRAEVISFFMTRGMEIPRDMGFNNNVQGTSVVQNGEVQSYNKVCRFKRGFRLPHKEIYQEHDLRFRVDKNIKLLGVSFGFLFSNTDMGVTVHCQGPWEKVQWTDMVQTYCRVSFEKMKTADLRLMFSEPARLLANHSYKVLVRVTRMTAGSTDVELWGGKDGLPTIEKDDAKFHFIKAACDPNKEVDPRELDTKQGMITELLYVTDDSPVTSTEVPVRRRRPQAAPEETSDKEEEKEEETKPAVPSFLRQRPTVKIEPEPEPTSYARRRRNLGETSAYRSWQPAGSSPTTETLVRRRSIREKTPEVKETVKTPEPTDSTPYYLRKRQSPNRTLAEKPSWLQPKTPTSATSPDSPFGERLSRVPSWKKTPASDVSSPTSTASRFGTSAMPSYLSRYSRDSSVSKDTSSSTTTPSYRSRYSRDSSVSKDTSSSTTTPSYRSRYSRDSSVSKDTSTSSTTPSYLSRYSRDTSVSKDASSKPSDSTTSSSLYRRDSTTGSSVNPYRRDSSITRRGTGGNSTYTTPSSSLTKTDSSSSYSRFGRDSAISKIGSRFEPRDSSATRYGSSLGSGYSSYGSRYLGSSYSRFR